jgi:hypothetical protein
VQLNPIVAARHGTVLARRDTKVSDYSVYNFGSMSDICVVHNEALAKLISFAVCSEHDNIGIGQIGRSI